MSNNVANTGHRNTGDWNTGHRNTGDWNTGDWNSGHRNTGDWNSGHRNTGDWNTGDYNTGHRNTGDWNTGDRNTGDWNSGHRNTGDWNTGDYNTGHRNTGDWNSGNYNTGFFNTKTPKKIKVFGKKCLRTDWDNAEKPACLHFQLTEWIYESEMSDAEKQENPNYLCTGGYLKKFGYEEAFTKSVTAASKEERDMIRALPNFDADIFFEISGVDLRLLDLE